VTNGVNIQHRILTGGFFIAFILQYHVLNRLMNFNSNWSDGLAWSIEVAVVGTGLRFLLPAYSHIGLCGVIFVWLCMAIQFKQLLVVILWLLSAWSVGLVLINWLRPQGNLFSVTATEAILLGAAMWVALCGVMIHFPINYPFVYLGLCVFSLYGFPSSLRSSQYWCQQIRITNQWMQSIPFGLWMAGLAIIGWILRWSSFPSLTLDDHAYHLRLWTELITYHKALFDVTTQIWSVAPFASDTIHASLSLMAGADARSAMNLGLAIALLVLMVRVMQCLNLSTWAQWLLLVLMASTPMLGYLLLSLQTELFLAVLALAGFRIMIDTEGDLHSQSLLGVLACSALCAATKLTGIVLGGSLLIMYILRGWQISVREVIQSGLLSWRAFIVVFPLIFVALHAYILAWWITGNPVFPLYNGIFHSSFYPDVNFTNPLYAHGFSLSSYVRVFFQTSKFFESYDYVAGWQYLILLPIALILLLRTNIPHCLRLGLLPLMIFGLVVFFPTQYWRYLFPVMPIAGLLMSTLFSGKNRYLQVFFIVLTLFCIMINLFFFPQIFWIMHDSSVQKAYSKIGKQQLMNRYAPVAALTSKINQLTSGARVIYPANVPYGAILQGTPLFLNWYSPARQARFLQVTDIKSMAAFIAQEKVDFVILEKDTQSYYQVAHALLCEYLEQYASIIAQESDFILYRLKMRD